MMMHFTIRCATGWLWVQKSSGATSHQSLLSFASLRGR